MFLSQAYNFQNQFWTSIRLIGTPPSARWGAVGGIDPVIMPSSGNNVSTIFNIAGGANNQTAFPSSELWQLNITGTLASDLFTIQGVWENISVPSSPLPGKVEAGGALISQSQATQTRIAISGGCGPGISPTNTNVSCIDPSTYVLTVSPSSSMSVGQCPAPRLGPVLVPNLNTASSSFASQTFMLLGTFDTSSWNDSGGLSHGEVVSLMAISGHSTNVLYLGSIRCRRRHMGTSASSGGSSVRNPNISHAARRSCSLFFSVSACWERFRVCVRYHCVWRARCRGFLSQ